MFKRIGPTVWEIKGDPVKNVIKRDKESRNLKNNKLGTDQLATPARL